MLNKVVLENFKCFREKTEFYLSRITIMYGKNGRGKSTVAQSLLLLSQSMKKYNTIENLQLIGRYAALGTYEDIISKGENKDFFGITLQSADEIVQMEFGKNLERPQMAKSIALSFNGESRYTAKNMNHKTNDTGINGFDSISDVTSLQNLRDLRYVSASRLGPQNYAVRKDSLEDDELGISGENIIQVLLLKGKEFQEEVRNVLSFVLGGAAIRVQPLNAEHIDFYLNSKDGPDTFRPMNVGFGYSYALPVIVAAFLAKNGSLLIIENPEAHLHPRAQSRIMSFLIKIAVKKELQIIIETHSDHVVNGMRIAIKEKVISSKDAHILYFSDEKKPIKLITSDINGTLSDYPDDFMDEWTEQLLKLV